MCVLNDQRTINGQRNNIQFLSKAHFGLGYLTGTTRALLTRIEISHTEFDLELENKLKIIISMILWLIDLLQNRWQLGGAGSIKIRMQVSSDHTVT